LVPLLDVLINDHLLCDSGMLRNHRLLTLLLHLDRAILKRVLVRGQRTVYGTPLHAHSFLLQADALGDGGFDHAAFDLDTPFINFPLSNPELLFNHGDYSLSVARGRLSILLALTPNLISGVGLRLIIKLVPATVAVSFTAVSNVHARMVENAL